MPPKTFKIDALKNKFDAGEVLFLEQELEEIESTFYENKLPDLVYREIIPVNSNFNPGAQAISYKMYTLIGMAKIIAANATKLPRVGVFAEKFTQPVHIIGVEFGWSFDDIRAAQMAGTPLDDFEVRAARRAVQQKESDIAFNGDATYGLPGLLTNENITFKAVVTGTAGFTWELKTTTEILKDVGDSVFDIIETTKGIYRADTIALPVRQYGLLATRTMPNTDTTILDHILVKNRQGYGIDRIVPLPRGELDSQFVGGTEDGMLMYNRSPEVLEQRIVMEMLIHDAQLEKLNINFPVEAKNGGVVVRYPIAIQIVTGI